MTIVTKQWLLIFFMVWLTACNNLPLEQSANTNASVQPKEEPMITESAPESTINEDINLANLPETVPELPFADNPDPSLCGIPQPWNNEKSAWLTGIYEGELIQPVVYLYDSHLRKAVVAQAPHGSEIKILLSQSNPELDYYMVKLVNQPPPNEGWIPAPFVSFEPLHAETSPVAVMSERNLQPQLEQATIPLDDIVTLLPRDAIPAILPEQTGDMMVSAAEAMEVGIPEDIQVMGVTINGESHAYPIPFMSRHEIVNAEVGGQKIAATW